jgi:ADP-heptose:LPS heptosyltransferase
VAGSLDKERHAVDEALDVVRYLGLPAPKPEFPVAFPAFEVDDPHPRVALAPCSRWRTKDWAPDRFAEVGRILRDKAGAAIYLVGGPGDRATCDRITSDLPGSVNLCGTTDLPRMGGVLSAMDLAVTVDTGPMHVAAAAGVPVLAVFGATDPNRTGPYGDGHRVVTVDDLDCRPCIARHCRRHDLACLDRIKSRQVADLALAMLDPRS